VIVNKLLVSISSSLKELRRLAGARGVDVARNSVKPQDPSKHLRSGDSLNWDEPATVKAIVDADTIEHLRKQGYQVDVEEDLDALGQQRQALVGQGNRFAHRVRPQSPE
jgi:hypothetical protein